MGLTLAEKIISQHLVEGTLERGIEIGLRIDQALTQDATGTMAFLQFEALGLSTVKTEVAVSYVDHNMLQTGFENADDHRFLQSIASKYGVYFSRPGNGICHQVHLERFSAPGKTLLGSDSHTPTSGGAGMLAIGAGGLDVAVAMGGGAFYTKMPKILGVHLKGKLRDWVAPKDIILYLLGKLTVKGGVGKIIEYFGNGVENLGVPDRSTITNMGAELGATTSIFPSDERTREYLQSQKRGEVWQPMQADLDCKYDEVIEIDLNQLEPMVAKPGSPDAVVPLSEVENLPVDQVLIGSCTNSSYKDLAVVAHILKGRTAHPRVSLGITPGSRQALVNASKAGFLETFVVAGARILESACGPCIGMGQAPATDAVSLRTFNRNFDGRSGSKNDKVYLVSPAIAATAAVTGCVTNPQKLGPEPQIEWPQEYIIDDSMIVKPAENPADVEVIRGPNIAPLPIFSQLEESAAVQVLIKLGDNISTDHILPAGSKILPLRSNVPKISEFVFTNVDAQFVARAKAAGSGIIIGGENYGQGSSREHAALSPRFLGVKAVIVKSFARIHKANLVNFGILPVEFADSADYDKIEMGDQLEIPQLLQSVQNSGEVEIINQTKNSKFVAKINLSKRERSVLAAGGLLNYTRANAAPLPSPS